MIAYSGDGVGEGESIARKMENGACSRKLFLCVVQVQWTGFSPVPTGPSNSLWKNQSLNLSIPKLI